MDLLQLAELRVYDPLDDSRRESNLSMRQCVAERVSAEAWRGSIKARGGAELGGYVGTIASLPGTGSGVPTGMHVIIADDGQIEGVVPELLERMN